MPSRTATSNTIPIATEGSPRSTFRRVITLMRARSARSAAVTRSRFRSRAISVPSSRTAALAGLEYGRA
jgi:hypothetical protein